MTRKCKTEGCAAEIEVPADPLLAKFTLFCPVCSEKRIAQAQEAQAAAVAAEKAAIWNRLCPPAYQKTTVDRLPDPAKAAQVLAWNYGPRGLLLHGKTGSGKSRCAWLLAGKVFSSGKSVKVLDSMAGFRYGAAFQNGGRDAEEWVESFCKCGLLLCDDVFKVKLTDSFEAAIFAITDYRLTHDLPVVATLNDTGQTLASRMSDDRGDAFVRRLKEMCDVIQF